MPDDLTSNETADVGDAGGHSGQSGDFENVPLSPNQVRQFFSAAPFAVAIFDRDMRCIAASRQWLKDYNLEDREVIGATQYEIFPNMADKWRDRYQRCLAGESFESQEEAFERPGGTEWIQWKMHPWRTDDGDVAGLFLFSEFISEQKKRAVELENNQAFLEVVLDSVHNGIVACDADGELTIFNAATKALHGLPAQRIPADQWSKHYDLYHPDGVTPLKKEEIPLFRALNDEIVDGAEMVIAPVGRPPRRILARGKAMFDAEGIKIGAVASMQDITEERKVAEQLRDSERQFRTLYNETPAMLHSVNREGELIRVSDFWLQSLGYERDEVIGKPFFDLLPQDSRAYVTEHILPAFVQEGHLENVEFKVNKKDGTAIDVQLSVVAQRDAEGVVVSSITVLAEITARKRAESELRKSEAQFRMLYDKTPAMFHSVNGQGRLIRVSAFWLDKLGYTSEEVIGQPLAKFLPEECGRILREDILPELLKAGYVENLDLEIFKKDGTLIDVQLSTSAEYNDDGTIKNTLTVLSDVSDRRRMEREVRRSEEQFRGAFETSPLGMALVSPSAEWIKVNTALCEMLGYSERELFGFNVRDITDPNDLDNDLEHVAQLLEGTKDSFYIEKRYLHKDGSTIWAWVSVILIRAASGEPVHFVTQILNLTERKMMERALRRSEEQFRSAYETSPLGIALVSPGGRWLAANTALCKTLGYTEKELIAKGIREITHPDDLDNEIADIVRLKDGDGENVQMEKRYLRKDGSTVWALVSISVVRDHKGDAAQFVFQMLDLTERREAEEQLLQAQKLEAVGQLTGGLAHDFNNLLAVILISLQLLERSHDDDPKSLKRIKAALDATERGADLTRRLLAFSRKQTLEQKVIDVESLVEGMIGLMTRSLGGAINLETRYAGDLWKIESDQSQLETGLLNLAINARDAMPSGGDLTIEARNVVIDEAYAGSHSEVYPGSYVLIAVSDTGTGIPHEVANKIFQPFFTTKEVGRGTGLGLSMVYGFVKQSKGHVEVYSEQGVGTSIKLYLPALTDARDEDVDLRHDTSGDVTGHGEKILVTEDDQAVRESVTALFKSLNYQVIEASNAAEALSILKTDARIDLLFSDIVMPGDMDGVTLASEVRTLMPELKVLLTTGFAEVAIARGKLPEADTEIIGKPYRRGDLAAKVRRLLDDQDDD